MKQDELTPEEIKRIWDEDGDGWISWVQFGLAVAKAQLAKSHGLDRPELREKIKETLRAMIIEYERAWRGKESKQLNYFTDKLLALYPNIEEAKREERERIFRDIDNAGLIGEHTDSPLHEIGATILDCPACCWYAYKALKEGK